MGCLALGQRAPTAAGLLAVAELVAVLCCAAHRSLPLSTPSCSADIGRLEAGWQARWQEQASSAADLRSRLEGLAASSTSQAQEVQGRLQVGWWGCVGGQAQRVAA